MACSNAFDAFRLATEHLTTELYRRATVENPSVWINAVPRTEYQSGVGLINSTFTIERTEPTADEEAWSPVTTRSDTTGTGNSCGNTWIDCNYGEAENKYSPERLGLRGPIICENEFVYNFQAERFMQAYLHQLAIRSERSLSNRLRNIYMHLTPHTVCDAGMTTDNGGSYTLNGNGTYTIPQHPTLTALPAATSQCTQDRLDVVAAQLNANGANNPDEAGFVTLGPDGPLYTLQLSQEASQNIQLNNSEFRQDYRYAEPSALLKRLGATRVIKNFRHLITLDPPRWSFSGGQYTRVNHWLMNNKSKGQGAEVNPDWDNPATAPYEGLIVLHPWVFNSEIVRPPQMPAGLKFDPENWMGEWMFRVGARRVLDPSTEGANDCYDPLEEIGRHFARYEHAPRAIFPQYGRLIIQKRCPNSSFTSVTCS